MNNDSKLLIFDQEFKEKYQVKYLVGIDEAGKGALAGPIFITGVCFLSDYFHSLVNDSKLLTKQQRSRLEEEILKQDILYKTVQVQNNKIDQMGLNQAIKEEIAELFNYFQAKVDNIYFLADFSPVYNHFDNIPIFNLKKGDQKSFHIAAASILAKVSRDRMMTEISKDFPEYNFSQNKGYGTKYHIEQIKKNGYCSHHRKSFKIKKLS
ncbi:ribonuclease HII [Mycoplasma sp. SG1]|uniref:ribonuclease HII n=1 Tax=Mycoplasma sp. SG1 TaxID=2810348 RepID=UPI0020240211|nr:ribonuclease HII [Mycoplasma sp. SG1]URM52778.1 ribonuclease HII [Mycoplasma sp. SG1]